MFSACQIAPLTRELHPRLLSKWRIASAAAAASRIIRVSAVFVLPECRRFSRRSRAQSAAGHQHSNQTEHATPDLLHLFQAWADQFLTTPRQGIRDTFLSASAKVQKAQLLAEYHQLKSDIGGIDFGDEFDLGVSYPLMQKLVGKLEYADFKAGDTASGKVDTRKVWLTLIFNY